jgi:hypothetical protein
MLAFKSGLFHINISFVLTSRVLISSEIDPYVVKGIETMEVKITRDEPEAAPDIIYTSAGNRHFGARAEYFMSRGPEYVAKALEVVNHVLQFFQHSLFTPLVRPIQEGDTCLKNPTWYDPLGNELETGIYTATARFIVPRRSKLDGTYFTPDYISDLADYMSSPREPSLVSRP